MRTITLGTIAAAGLSRLASQAVAQGEYPIGDRLAAMVVQRCQRYQGGNQNE